MAVVIVEVATAAAVRGIVAHALAALKVKEVGVMGGDAQTK